MASASLEEKSILGNLTLGRKLHAADKEGAWKHLEAIPKGVHV